MQRATGHLPLALHGGEVIVPFEVRYSVRVKKGVFPVARQEVAAVSPFFAFFVGVWVSLTVLELFCVEPENSSFKA